MSPISGRFTLRRLIAVIFGAFGLFIGTIFGYIMIQSNPNPDETSILLFRYLTPFILTCYFFYKGYTEQME